jgi:NAD(P)-dependent dehydrogenase (short-subunit alcohol dehydrogenase family)
MSTFGSTKAALNMLGTILSVEEPEIMTLSIRPGVVDTNMQKAIREEGRFSFCLIVACSDNRTASDCDPGSSKMHPEDHKKFIDLQQSGNLLPPEKPASVIANLAISGLKSGTGSVLREPIPKDWSGSFLSWDDPKLALYQRQ